MFLSFYQFVLRLASHRYASWFLGIFSFFESIFIPIPVEAMLIPMSVANRQRVFRYAFIASATSVLGGIAGYLLGKYFFEFAAQPLLEFYGFSEKFNIFLDLYRAHGVAILLIAGISPFPFKLVTIASGSANFNFLLFLLSSIIARFTRFYIVSTLLFCAGSTIHTWIHAALSFTSTLIFLIIGICIFLLIAYFL